MDKNIDNTGFGTSVTKKYARFINKNGSHNVVHRCIITLLITNLS
ncbi:hypothetical protein WFZ85_06400 [Flavobacterium sp. j3]|uniref:Uncharacterized protein n=1 Tax=Flavobacterium aureirubrum TaxID=3133147 RepID=A0ABU9N5Y7_9FLAO